MNMIKPAGVRMFGIVAASATTLAVFVSPAAAVERRAYHESDRVQGDRSWVCVYDGERDGHGVYANLHLHDNGGTKVWGWQSSSWAPNGLWDGTGHDEYWGCYDYFPNNIDWIQVCEDTVGCSGWVKVYE